MTDNRALARNLFDVGVAAADPYSAVARVLADVQTPSLIIAVGKAATRMAQAALATFSVPCIIVTNYENATPVAGAQVFAAGHPVPDIAGAKAAHAVISALGQAKGSVLVLISRWRVGLVASACWVTDALGQIRAEQGVAGIGLRHRQDELDPATGVGR